MHSAIGSLMELVVGSEWDLRGSACPYMWPYCKQPLFAGRRPLSSLHTQHASFLTQHSRPSAHTFDHPRSSLPTFSPYAITSPHIRSASFLAHHIRSLLTLFVRLTLSLDTTTFLPPTYTPSFFPHAPIIPSHNNVPQSFSHTPANHSLTAFLSRTPSTHKLKETHVTRKREDIHHPSHIPPLKEKFHPHT